MKKRYFVFTIKGNSKESTHYVEVKNGRCVSVGDMAKYALGDRSRRDFALLFLMELSKKDFDDLIERKDRKL